MFFYKILFYKKLQNSQKLAKIHKNQKIIVSLNFKNFIAHIKPYLIRYLCVLKPFSKKRIFLVDKRLTNMLTVGFFSVFV